MGLEKVSIVQINSKRIDQEPFAFTEVEYPLSMRVFMFRGSGGTALQRISIRFWVHCMRHSHPDPQGTITEEGIVVQQMGVDVLGGSINPLCEAMGTGA